MKVDRAALVAHVAEKRERPAASLRTQAAPSPTKGADATPIVARATLTPGIYTVDGMAGLWAAGAVLALALRDGRLVTVLDDTQPVDPAKE